jgi:cytoplasmic iron level regulating protein YaaA (DUF328/UPF0246 family)
VLILLPPSESKAAPARRGRPLDLDQLSFPDLSALRRKVLAALIETSTRPDAADLLGVGTSLAAEVAANTRLETIPAMPAHALYTGVLYDALGWAGLPPEARRFGARRVLISSALFGLVRPGDRIPPYRLAMDARLPGLGPLARLWRERLPDVLLDDAGRRGVIVDCRSGPYAAAAPLTGAAAARVVPIRVLREEAGRRTVVSHLAKHTRGEVARHLLEAGESARTPAELGELLAQRWSVELTTTPKPALDVILH